MSVGMAGQQASYHLSIFCGKNLTVNMLLRLSNQL